MTDYIQLCKQKVFELFENDPVYIKTYTFNELSSSEFNLNYILYFWKIFKNQTMIQNNPSNHLLRSELKDIKILYDKFPIIKQLFEAQLMSNDDYVIVFTSKSSENILIHGYFPQLYNQNSRQSNDIEPHVIFEYYLPEMKWKLQDNVCSLLCYC